MKQYYDKNTGINRSRRKTIIKGVKVKDSSIKEFPYKNEINNNWFRSINLISNLSKIKLKDGNYKDIE